MHEINFERFRNQCLQARTEHLFAGLKGLKLEVPSLSPAAKRRTRIFGAALVLAAAAFWAIMLTSPPITEAEDASAGLNMVETLRNAPLLPVGPAYDPI